MLCPKIICFGRKYFFLEKSFWSKKRRFLFDEHKLSVIITFARIIETVKERVDIENIGQ